MITASETRAEPHPCVSPAPHLDVLFAPRATGYLGADVAHSVPLPDGRVLWLFGDTLVGTMEGHERRIEAMPRNSVAIQCLGAPCPEKIDLIFADAAGRPRSFWNLPPSETDNWFWPGTALCVEGELFVFGYGVSHCPNEIEALSFRVHDGWILRVRDTSGHPLGWRIEAERAPFPIEGAWFCSGSCLDPPWVYLVGQSRTLRNLIRQTGAVLARVPIDDLLARGAAAAFEYWSDAGGAPDWAVAAESLVPLYQPGVTECAVIHDAPRRRYVATTYFGRTPEFFLVTAPALTGPWTEPIFLFNAEEHDPPEEFLSYTFRLHPHLASGPDEIVATHVVNPLMLTGLTRNPNVYYPRFLRIDLSRL